MCVTKILGTSKKELSMTGGRGLESPKSKERERERRERRERKRERVL
jgi:hypothetical protein